MLTRVYLALYASCMIRTISAPPTDEFRSTNGQLQWIINEALRKSGRLKKK